MIFNNKSIGHGFTDPQTLSVCPRSNSCTKPELPAPNPARVIRKLNLSDHRKPISRRDIRVAGEQRSFSGPLLDDVVVEFLACPGIVFSLREIAVQDDDFHFDCV